MALIIDTYMRNVPTTGHCDACGESFSIDLVKLANPKDAIPALMAEYDKHNCRPKREDFSQADSGQLAAELGKRADETRKRAKPGEDASQAAARIVREATENK